MAHRRLVIQERITAIVGAALLFSLVGLSYYYSIQISLDDLKYVPSASSPDFTATDVTMSDFNEQGVASQRLAAQSVEHYSDERMMAHQATYHTLDPSKPQIVARADKAESLDGLETVQLTGNVRFTRAASEEEPDLYFETEYLNGFLDTHQFETDRPVFMRRGEDTTSSQNGMRYDNVAHTVELTGSVQTVLHPQSKSIALP